MMKDKFDEWSNAQGVLELYFEDFTSTDEVSHALFEPVARSHGTETSSANF